MIDSNPKLKVILFTTLVTCMVSCGATLPLQEFSGAKQGLSRAKFFNSEKYAKTEFNESRMNLVSAHENAFSSSPDFKKVAQFVQVSTEKSNEAIKKSIPDYIKDLQKEVDDAIESANVAFAETLASDLYEQATLLKSEGDELVKNAQSKQANTGKDDSAEKDIIYQEFEKGIKKYKDSIVASEKAKDLSLAQAQAIIDSSSDIESNLDLIDKYSAENKATLNKTSSLRKEYKIAVEQMEKGSIRDAFKKLEEIRVGANELLIAIILPYAKERIKTATIKIEDADNFLHSDDENAKSTVASDTLVASKEAFSSSVDLLAKERYYDSIQQSDESIRLAEEILKSRSDSFVSKKRSNKEKSDKCCTDLDCKDLNKKSKECSDTNCKDLNKKSKECSDANCKDSCESKKTIGNIIKESKHKSSEDEFNKPISNKNTAKKNILTPKNTEWKKHIVQKKIPPETLWRIAADKKYYGDKSLWKEIYNANKKNIANPNLIYPKQVILIPIKTDKADSKKLTKVKK